jgi:hypothetical protein
MPAFFIYLLKVNLALILFYLVYRCCLRRLTFYTANRWYLLAGIICSSVWPLVKLHSETESGVATSTTATIFYEYSPDWNRLEETMSNTSGTMISGWTWVQMGYWAGVVIFSFILIIQLISLFKLYRQSAHAGLPYTRFTQKDIRPFSFASNIFINPSLHTGEELNHILAHEQVHVRQWHSVDMLLSEINKIFHWFNPGVWLIKSAVRENLEFIADRYVLLSGVNKKLYQYELLSQTAGRYVSTGITGQFALKQLKRRIIMMNSSSSRFHHRFRYLLLLPLLLTVIVLVAQKRITKTTKETKQTIPVLADTAQAPVAAKQPKEKIINSEKTTNQYYSAYLDMYLSKPEPEDFEGRNLLTLYFTKDNKSAAYVFTRSGNIVDSITSDAAVEEGIVFKNRYEAPSMDIPNVLKDQVQEMDIFNDLPDRYYMIKEGNSTRHVPYNEWVSSRFPQYVLNMKKYDQRSSLFIGINNYVTVSIPNGCLPQLELTIDQGDIAPVGAGRYQVRVAHSGTATLLVHERKKDGSRVLLQEKNFPVKFISPAEPVEPTGQVINLPRADTAYTPYYKVRRGITNFQNADSANKKTPLMRLKNHTVAYDRAGNYVVIKGEDHVNHVVVGNTLMPAEEFLKKYDRNSFVGVGYIEAKTTARYYNRDVPALLYLRTTDPVPEFKEEFKTYVGRRLDNQPQ